jgi:competence protein ComEC
MFLFPGIPAAEGNHMTMHFLDVGQSDSIYIEVSDGKNMLIDAGSNHASNKIINYLHRLGVKKIDYVVATHPHHDHIGSLDDVIEQFAIGKLYTSNVTHDTSSFYDVIKAIKKYKIKVKNVKKSSEIKLAENVKVKLFGPLVDQYASINEQSIIIHVTHDNNSFLLMGDAGIPVEEKLLVKHKNLNVDVLKVGHHGGISATSNEFLKKVKPNIAVISVGKNNYARFPAASVLKTLLKNNIKVLRTDKLGTISAISNGDKIIWFSSNYGFIYLK